MCGQYLLDGSMVDGRNVHNASRHERIKDPDANGDCGPDKTSDNHIPLPNTGATWEPGAPIIERSTCKLASDGQIPHGNSQTKPCFCTEYEHGDKYKHKTLYWSANGGVSACFLPMRKIFDPR